MHELYTDFKKDYDAVRSVVLLGVSAILRKACTFAAWLHFPFKILLSVRLELMLSLFTFTDAKTFATLCNIKPLMHAEKLLLAKWDTVLF